MDDKLYIVMPAYNEEKNVKEVVEQWCRILHGGGRLIVADSGSTDATHSILAEMQKEFSCLEILSNTDKQHGPKCLALYKYAIECGADFIFQTDSDGQTNPDEFADFWKMRNEYDVILGVRKGREDGKVREFVELVVCFLLKLYFGVNVPDANAPFRLMKADVVDKYLDRMPPEYNLPNIMLTTYFAYYKEKMTFRKISFKPRQGGVNSVNIPRIIKIGWKALSDFNNFRKKMRQ